MTMLKDHMDNLKNNYSDTITLFLIFLFHKTMISVSHHHGTEPLDFGTLEPEFQPNNSLDTPKKFSLVLSHQITDKLSHLELTKPSNYGTTLENVNSPVKSITTLNGFHVLDTLLFSKPNPKLPLTHILPPPVGMEDSKFGTPISKSEPLSNLMMDLSTPLPSPPTANILPLEEETNN